MYPDYVAAGWFALGVAVAGLPNLIHRYYQCRAKTTDSTLESRLARLDEAIRMVVSPSRLKDKDRARDPFRYEEQLKKLAEPMLREACQSRPSVVTLTTLDPTVVEQLLMSLAYCGIAPPSGLTRVVLSSGEVCWRGECKVDAIPALPVESLYEDKTWYWGKRDVIKRLLSQPTSQRFGSSKGCLTTHCGIPLDEPSS